MSFFQTGESDVTEILQDSCDPPTDEDFAGGLTKQQLVIEFDEELWLVCCSYTRTILSFFDSDFLRMQSTRSISSSR